MVKHVVKRDGRIVIFDNRKIVDAILKAMNVTEECVFRPIPVHQFR